MSNRIKLLAIINPISGTGRQKGIDSLLKIVLDATRFDLTCKTTQFPGHAAVLAMDAIKAGFQAVIAVGGDGTVNEVARTLAGSELTLGIVPCGSGNGLARHLGIPMNPKKSIKWINKAVEKKIDTVQANEHLFANVAGIGFDAHISHQFAQMSSRGLLSYIKATVSSFFNYTDQEFVVETETGIHQLKGFILSFANSSQFGNNAYIAPQACIKDGEINLMMLRKPRIYQIPGLVIRLFAKRIDGSSLATELKGSKFLVRQSGQLGHVDGEPIEFGKEINLMVKPQSLKIFAQKEKQI